MCEEKMKIKIKIKNKKTVQQLWKQIP